MAPGRRHVVVTGAAGGIGRAVAVAFAAQPDTVLTLVDVDPAGLESTGRELNSRTVRADLTEPGAPGAAVARAWEAGGCEAQGAGGGDASGIDVLVNAAGVYPSLDMIDVTDGDDRDGGGDGSGGTSGVELWDRIFALNCRAPALATAALARRAVAAGRTASVVNISSGAALRARPGGGPYAASKAALEMATRAAALELGPHGIRVNAVSPGFVAVGSDCNPVAPEYAAAVSANPLGRPGTPEDIARAVCWIAGEEAAWITGEILRVDGGSGTGAGHLPRLWPPRTTARHEDEEHEKNAENAENEAEGSTV